MRKYALLFCGLTVLSACDKHDPILPGVRTAIFDTGAGQNVLNTNVPDLPDAAPVRVASECNYSIDSTNTIRDGERKIFVGFPAPNSMDIETKPVCDSGYVYAGLNTGSVVKVSPASRRVMWMADVFRESNMTGGAATVDIVAPLIIDGANLYVGGMGDAFCKVNTSNGAKKWCTPVGTRYPFVVLKNVAYVVGLDNTLYAIRLSDGAIYWHTKLDDVGVPTYDNKTVTVAKQKFDAYDGKEL